MFIPLPNFGRYGVVADTLNSALPIGTWTDAKNMRFSGIQMEKMLEPTLSAMLVDSNNDALTEDAQWMQGWSDGLSTYVAIATQTELWFLLRNESTSPGVMTLATRAVGGSYSPNGKWDSFAWGDTCIFNNQVDPPQIFDRNTNRFIDLPNWGVISSAQDIADGVDPSINTGASCAILRPYRNFLVAFGIIESGIYQPNAVWWSDATALATLYPGPIAGGGPPLWDYESPATLSGKAEVGAGSGAIRAAEILNENMVVYTEGAVTLMLFTQGVSVMSFRRIFGKGAAGLRCVTEFNNRHFVVGRDQIYVHDGSSVQLIAKDRVETEFFSRLGKGGRFGGNGIDWDNIRVVRNPDRKEIIVYTTGSLSQAAPVPCCFPISQTAVVVPATLTNFETGTASDATNSFSIESNPNFLNGLGGFNISQNAPHVRLPFYVLGGYYFKFSVCDSEKRILASLSQGGATTLNHRLQIYDSNGDFFRAIEQYEFVSLPPGDYYLKVEEDV